MINPRFVFIISVLLFFTVLQLFISPAQAQNQPQAISKMYGEITLMSNYVEKGLTQSDKSPALGADLGYGFGDQGRIGFAAYSVQYPNEDTSISMRAYGAYKFIFTPNTDLKLRNDLVRYFSSGTRNNIIIKLDQNFFGYHMLFEYEDNFEGTKTNRNWFAFHKDWPIGTDYQFNLTAGYSMLELDGYNNYFDTKTGVSYVNSSLTAGIFHTFVTSSSQFGEQGKMSLFLELIAKF